MTNPSDQLAIQQGCTFDAARADRALAWIRDVLRVRLYAWQRDCLRQYFGWRRADGGYRFQKISIWIPKKNGKTYLIAALLGYKLFELRGCDLYSVAYNSKQASILLDTLIKIFRECSIGRLMAKGTVRTYSSPYRREIRNAGRQTKYLALADNVNANDGLIGNVLVVDELHRMKNVLYDVCAGMLANITDALEVVISTAGSGDKTHRSWQKYDYAKKVLAGELVDPTVLVVIYEHPAPDQLHGEEIYTMEALLACNPVLVEDAAKRAEAERELLQARTLRNDAWWRRFRLNQWLAQDGEVYLAADEWTACQVEPAAPEQLEDLDLYVGVDSSGGQWDFRAFTFLWSSADGPVYQEDFTFAVADRLDVMAERDQLDYRSFGEELTLIPAAAVSDEWFADWLLARLSGKRVKAIGADPAFAGYLMEKLIAAGYPVVQVMPTANRMLSPVILDYAERVRRRRLVHPPNALVAWQLSCVRRLTLAKDVCKLVKAGSNSRGQAGAGHIDNFDAAINALAVLRAEEIRVAGNADGVGIVTV